METGNWKLDTNFTLLSDTLGGNTDGLLLFAKGLNGLGKTCA